MSNDSGQRRRPEAAIKLNQVLGGCQGENAATSLDCNFDELALDLAHGKLEEQLTAFERILTHPDSCDDLKRFALKTALESMQGRFGSTLLELKQLKRYLLIIGMQAAGDPQSLDLAFAILRGLHSDAGEAHDLPRLRLLRDALAGMMSQMLGESLPLSPQQFVRAFKRMEQLKKRDAALACVFLGSSYYPHDASLLELAAVCAERAGRMREAAERYKLLIAMRPDKPQYMLRKASALLHHGEEIESVLTDLNAYLARHPRSQKAITLKLDALLQLDQLEQVRSFADEAIAKHPNNATLYVRRAYALAGMGIMKQARADMAKAQELDPKAATSLPPMRHAMYDFPPAGGEEDDVYSAHSRGGDGFLEETVQIPQQSFSDIGGLKPIIEQLRRHIEYPLKFPELAKQYGIEAGGGIILYGPPGCGKTMLARAVAGETGCKLINVNMSRILDKWVGNTEKAIAMVFSTARKNAPSILFFDEVDAIGRSRDRARNTWEVSFVSQLLAEMDGIQGRSEKVLMLGATNQPWNVDLAMRRSGRLGKLLYVAPPDEDARRDIFGIYIARKPLVADGIDLAELARRTPHHSADAIRAIVDEAAAIPWLQAVGGGEARPVCQADLLAALEKVPPDLQEWQRMLARFEEFAEPVQLSRRIGFSRLACGE